MGERRQKHSVVFFRETLPAAQLEGTQPEATHALGEQDVAGGNRGAHIPVQPGLWAPSRAGLGVTLGGEGGEGRGLSPCI